MEKFIFQFLEDIGDCQKVFFVFGWVVCFVVCEFLDYLFVVIGDLFSVYICRDKQIIGVEIIVYFDCLFNKIRVMCKIISMFDIICK